MTGKQALLALALAGCASDAATRTDAARFERQLEELRRRSDGDRRAVEELENRVFILEDKLDTARVASEKTADVIPKLPVVTKKVAPPEPPEPIEPPVAEPMVADDGPPIVIKLDGRDKPRSSSRPASPPLDLASVNEKLPVVPLPKKGAPASAPVPAPAASPDAMSAYQTAYQALGRREHAVAIRGFRSFLSQWPSHDYADNAQYWLGEAYYDQADYQTALAEFRTVLKRYPGGNKAPDALLKVAFCMGKLGDGSGARDIYTQVVDIYPKTDAARLATQRLAELAGSTQ